jgi:hypothetical protein
LRQAALRISKSLIAFGQSPLYQLIDMTFYEIVRVFVVGAEHQPRSVLGHEWNQRLEVFGRTSFT